MKPWTPDDRLALRQLYPGLDDAAVARILERTAAEVREEAARLALGKDKARFPGQSMPRWSPEEIARLTGLYANHSNREIARILGRSAASVARQGARLGLQKTELRRAIAGATNVRVRRISPPRIDPV